MSYDEREIGYDLLVSVPLDKGADFVGKSGLGDVLNYSPVDPHTLLSKHDDHIFVLGDASNAPTSKAGSVAHFAVDLFEIVRALHPGQGAAAHLSMGTPIVTSKQVTARACCSTSITPGTPARPLPAARHRSLCAVGRAVINHWGKFDVRWLYWNILVRGLEMPVSATMSMTGKRKVSAR